MEEVPQAISQATRANRWGIEEDLIAKFHKLQGDTETLEGHIVIEMSDCGGQPQFLEVLARYDTYYKKCLLNSGSI